MRLAESGHEVSLLARGAHLAAIREHGLRLESGDRVATRRFPASDHPADLGIQDYVLIALKNTAMEAVAPTLRPLLGPDSAVVSLMNGVPWWFFNGFGGALDGRRIHAVDPRGAIAAAIEPQRIIGGVAMCSCSLPTPGIVRHASGNGIAIGEPNGEVSARAARLGEAFTAAGFSTDVTRDIRRAVWLKLIGNLCFNTVSALTGTTTDVLIDTRETHALFVAMMSEALELAAKLGLSLDVDPAARIASSRSLGRIKSSMLQDVEAGKAIEFDAIIGAVIELGDWTGLPLPHTRTVHALLKMKAMQLGLLPGAGAP